MAQKEKYMKSAEQRKIEKACGAFMMKHMFDENDVTRKAWFDGYATALKHIKKMFK